MRESCHTNAQKVHDRKKGARWRQPSMAVMAQWEINHGRRVCEGQWNMDNKGR